MSTPFRPSFQVLPSLAHDEVCKRLHNCRDTMSIPGIQLCSAAKMHDSDLQSYVQHSLDTFPGFRKLLNACSRLPNGGAILVCFLVRHLCYELVSSRARRGQLLL
jgi:hypothetical protein